MLSRPSSGLYRLHKFLLYFFPFNHHLYANDRPTQFFLLPSTQHWLEHHSPTKCSTTDHYQSLKWLISELIFTAQHYASAVCAVAFVRPFVCLSLCMHACHKSTVCSTTHDSLGQGSVVRRQRHWRNSNRITPTWAPYTGGLGKIGHFRAIFCYVSFSETVKGKNVNGKNNNWKRATENWASE